MRILIRSPERRLLRLHRQYDEVVAGIETVVTKRDKFVAHADGRRAILERTIELVHEMGPASVHPNEICAELGLSKSLVNFHFGGRDGLLAEAIASSYVAYVTTLQVAAEAAGPDPVARLLGWVEAQVEWTSAHPGLAAALHFPVEASSVVNGYPTALAEQMNHAAVKNFSNLQNLVRKARLSLHSRSDPSDPAQVALDAVTIEWITLGMSVSCAGTELSSSPSGAQGNLSEARENAKAEIVALLSR